MTQATWHSASTGFAYKHRSGWLSGFRPPSEEFAVIIAIVAVVVSVVVLHQRDAVKPRPAEDAGIRIETTALTPVEVPLVAPAAPAPVVPPAPDVLAQLPLPNTDIGALPAIRNLVTQTGAVYDSALVTHGQLEGAGEVALVPLQSGGSGGAQAVAVVGNGKEGPYALTLASPEAASRSRMRAGIENGELVVTTAVLGDEDPLCCPSATKRSYYTWDGSRLRLQREVTTANVNAKD